MPDLLAVRICGGRRLSVGVAEMAEERGKAESAK
jgi:hypothetical protein